MVRNLHRKLADSPVLAVFFASLVLSAIARTGTLINRDGMLYVQTARVFLDDGLNAALSVYSWPFFPILFAGFSRITGLDLESAGYLLNAFFMAGACALLVDIGRKQYPEATWLIVLTVLALPGLNDYRDELLREYGAWFFMMLALWLANRYSEKPASGVGLLVIPVLALGALFRPEVAALFPAVLAWLFFALPKEQRNKHLLIICAPAFLGGIVVLLVGLELSLFKQSRLVSDLSLLFFPGFEESLNGLKAVLPYVTDDSAKVILVAGSLAIPPVRFVEKLGVFLLPLLFVLFRYRSLPMWRKSGVLLWAAGMHLLVLSVFALQLHFLAGRYVAPLYLLLAPVIAYATYCVIKGFGRFCPWIYAALAVVALSNVVSTSPEKMHFVHAGKWLAVNVSDSSRVYNESGRAAYFAGWRQKVEMTDVQRESLPAAMKEGRYDIAVLEASRNDNDLEQWLENSGLIVVKRFDHENGDRVLVVSLAWIR